jgi:hypothetical protein
MASNNFLPTCMGYATLPSDTRDCENITLWKCVQEETILAEVHEKTVKYSRVLEPMLISASIHTKIFVSVSCITAFALFDLLLFLSKNNNLLHPYISFTLLVAGQGLLKTFFAGGKTLTTKNKGE